MQQQGFDYTYDKRHYDRLRARDPAAVRGHLLADLEFQRRSVRFFGFGSGKRVPSQLKNVTQITAIALT